MSERTLQLARLGGMDPDRFVDSMVRTLSGEVSVNTSGRLPDRLLNSATQP